MRKEMAVRGRPNRAPDCKPGYVIAELFLRFQGIEERASRDWRTGLTAWLCRACLRYALQCTHPVRTERPPRRPAAHCPDSARRRGTEGYGFARVFFD